MIGWKKTSYSLSIDFTCGEMNQTFIALSTVLNLTDKNKKQPMDDGHRNQGSRITSELKRSQSRKPEFPVWLLGKIKKMKRNCFHYLGNEKQKSTLN